jgi:hypothetical protein
VRGWKGDATVQRRFDLVLEGVQIFVMLLLVWQVYYGPSPADKTKMKKLRG